MCRPWAMTLIAVFGLGCSSRGDPRPVHAVPRAHPATAPMAVAGVASAPGVPLTLSLNITPVGARGTGEQFAASGDGECLHHARPAAHAGVEWEVRYRGESGPGIRMLLLRTAPARDGSSDDVDVELDAGDAMRLIRGRSFSNGAPGDARAAGRAHVSIAPLDSGARLTVDGVFADGAQIGGRIECARLSSEP